jgi:SNF2 family DNA or RNA helicase
LGIASARDDHDHPLRKASNAFWRGHREEATSSTDPKVWKVFHSFVDQLQTYMIKHSKDQQIKGATALALPESTTNTIWLDMSTHEQRLLNQTYTRGDVVDRYKAKVTDSFTLERCFEFRLPKQALPRNKGGQMLEAFAKKIGGQQVAAYRLVASECTKITYLREDLKTMQMSEPAFKVVVFTKYLPVHDALVRALRDDFPAKRVMDFKGGKDCFRRDKIIREFQNTEYKHLPSILVIMIKTGNVGITLTAASRVYLMEPALDPAVEVQAAGRIHLLGQTKAVQVKRLVFRNSYEHNIVKLQTKLLSGEIKWNGQHVPAEAVQILAEGVKTK